MDDPSGSSLPADGTSRRARLWHYFRRYGWWFAGGGVALVFTNLFGLAIPEQVGLAVEQINGAQGGFSAQRYELAVAAGVTIIALALGAALSRIISRVLIFNAGRFIEYDIRNELYDKLTRLDAPFYQRFPTGDITSRVTNDVSYIRLLYAIAFLHVINTALAYGIAIDKMIALDPVLTLASLMPFPFLVLGLRFVIQAIFKQTKLVQAQLSTLSNRVQENLSGIAVVKTFNLEEMETERFGQESRVYFDHGIKLALIRNAMIVLTTFVSGSATLVVIWLGSRRVIEGSLSLGEFIEFNSYVVALAFPTTALGWVFSVWHRGLAAFDRVLELSTWPVRLRRAGAEQRALPARRARASGDGQGAVPSGRVVFDQVSFAYEPGDEPVLDGVSLTIEPGTRVAIVGRTGSGKSTLLKLLARVYDPQQGRVLVDGVDLSEIKARAWRSEVGYVPQEPFLFSMTIAQNLTFGLDALEHDPRLAKRPKTRSLLEPERLSQGRDELLAEALEVAGLTQDVQGFPQGLETRVGERGITLSGGQKQRVTLARALLTDPRLLILDDALSSVDTQTEEKILSHLDVLMRGRTSVFVTHRYSALASMDQVLVMDQGRVVERGHHEELMARGGLYARMVSEQTLREQLDAKEDGDPGGGALDPSQDAQP